jgi:hypothetical protein
MELVLHLDLEVTAELFRQLRLMSATVKSIYPLSRGHVRFSNRRQTNGRSKQTCDLTSSIVPRGTSFHRTVDSRFSPIAADLGWLSCGCNFLGPPELGAVNPYAAHDDGEPTRGPSPDEETKPSWGNLLRNTHDGQQGRRLP